VAGGAKLPAAGKLTWAQRSVGPADILTLLGGSLSWAIRTVVSERRASQSLANALAGAAASLPRPESCRV